MCFYFYFFFFEEALKHLQEQALVWLLDILVLHWVVLLSILVLFIYVCVLYHASASRSVAKTRVFCLCFYNTLYHTPILRHMLE